MDEREVREKSRWEAALKVVLGEVKEVAERARQASSAHHMMENMVLVVYVDTLDVGEGKDALGVGVESAEVDGDDRFGSLDRQRAENVECTGHDLELVG